MIKKNCVICGKEIEVINPRYCLCSDECRKVRSKIEHSKLEYRAKKNEKRRKCKREQRRLHPKVVPCKICGKPVEPEFHGDSMCRTFYHESCVLSEALQAVSEGLGWNDKRIKRANNLYGYTLKELREEMAENNEKNNI